MNPVAESLTGWELSEACDQPLEKIFDIINEETRKPVQNPFGKVMREGTIVGLENHTVLIAKDGKETPIEDSAAPIRDASGNTMGAVMVFHDVTEQRGADRALRQSEARLNLAMEAGQMGAWEWTIASGKATWSPTLEAIYGLFAGTSGGGFEDLQRNIHPDDWENVLLSIQESIKSRKDYGVEYRIIKPDGMLCWIEARGKLFIDGQGNPERMAGICMDITARKKVEEALRKSEEFNRTIIESGCDCIKTLSLDGVLLWISESAQTILCVTSLREVIGKSWLEFWTGEDRAAALAAIQTAAAGGSGNFVGWHAILDQPRCWDVVITPILDRSGNPEKLLAISRDITERRNWRRFVPGWLPWWSFRMTQSSARRLRESLLPRKMRASTRRFAMQTQQRIISWPC